MLYGELEDALQLDKEAKLALAHNSALRQTADQDDEHLGTDYAGQARYNYYPKEVRSRIKSKGRTRRTPLDIWGCFN